MMGCRGATNLVGAQRNLDQNRECDAKPRTVDPRLSIAGRFAKVMDISLEAVKCPAQMGRDMHRYVRLEGAI